jgi:hypothetical protein
MDLTHGSFKSNDRLIANHSGKFLRNSVSQKNRLYEELDDILRKITLSLPTIYVHLQVRIPDNQKNHKLLFEIISRLNSMG